MYSIDRLILRTLLYSLFQSKDKWVLYNSQNFFKLFVNVVSSRHICKSRRNTNHTPSSPWVKLVIHTWNFQTFEHVSFCCDVLIIQVFNDMKIWISIPKAASNVLGGCPISTVVNAKNLALFIPWWLFYQLKLRVSSSYTDLLIIILSPGQFFW